MLLGLLLGVALLQDERPFVSAKKVMMEMGEPYKSGVELLSFHTVSKVSQ
jgi:glutamate--glyoxylate aminotransferase